MKNGKLSGKKGFGQLAGKFRRLFNLKKRVRQMVSAFLVLTMLFGAFVFDIEMFKAWAQSGCGGPDQIFQNCALGGGQVETDLTNQAVDDVISMYKLPISNRQLVLQSMRNEVRGMLYVRLLELIKKSNKTPAEAQAVAVFADRLKSLRVRAATEARNEYNRWTQNACAGYQPPAPYTYNPSGCTFYTITLNGAPTSPTFEEFQQFGAAIAYQGLFTPEAQRISERTALNITSSVSLASIGAAGIIGTTVGSTLTLGSLEAVLPFAAETWGKVIPTLVSNAGKISQFIKIPLPAANSGAVGGTVVGGVAAVVVATIAILVTQTLAVVNQAQVPDKLNQAVIDAQNANINLNNLLTTDAGNSEIYSIFIFETLPDFPNPVAPPADPQDRPFVVYAPATDQTVETQSLDVRLGWDNPRLNALRLSGTLFAYAPTANDSQRQSILIQYLDWNGKTRMAYRVGGQFFVVDPSNINSGEMVNELFMVTETANSQPVNVVVRIKFTEMKLFDRATVPSRCGVLVTPNPGVDEVIGRVTDAGEPTSSLTVTVNGGSTATVNGITLRNLRFNSNYEVIGNVLSTDVPPPATANFTLAVRNSIGQEQTVPVVLKKTAVLNSLPGQITQEGTVGTPFSMVLGSTIETGCASVSFDYSISGDIPPGLRIEGGFPNVDVSLRGTPTSGGKFIFTITKNYSNGESVSQTYYFFIRPDAVRMDDSAVSWWRAEDSAADHFNRANGTIVGNVGFDTGKVNRGFNFDGSDSYIKLPGSTFSPGNSFTFETWFKTGEKGVILGSQVGIGVQPYGNPTGARPLIYVNHNGKLRVQMFKDQLNRFITSQQNVDDSQYHHVAVTYDWTNQTRTVYLDGVTIGSLVGDQEGASEYQFGTGYVADAASGGTNGWLNFRGVLDEPTLYSHTLNATEITKIYQAGTFGKLYLKIRPFAPQVRDGNDGGMFIEADGSAPPLRYSVRRTVPFITVVEQETSNFTNLIPANYELSVIDAFGLTYTTPVVVPNAPPNITVTSERQSPRCFGEQSGSMRVLINGGTSIPLGSYQYSILGGANFQNSNYFTNLNGGSYTPTVLDVGTNTVFTGEQVTLTQPAPFALSPAAFPNASVNVPYSQTFTLSGNNVPYTLTAEGNDINNNYALPAGLSATVTPNSITISGTPTASGTFPIRILYYDQRDCPGSKTMNLNVIAAGNVSIGGRIVNGGQGLPNATVTLSGGANLTATTDASGNYSFNTLPSNQDYTATVSLNGYSFAQPTLTFNGVNANIGDADFPTAFTHYEGDIAPRLTGDGSVDVRDYVTLNRILNNQEPLPAAGGEWQRASVAPRSSLGSTTLQGADLTQTLNYIVRNNPLTLVGGPANPATPVLKGGIKIKTVSSENLLKTEANVGAPATVSADTVAASGGTATVPIRMTSDGTVTAAQFTITYDSTKLSNPSIISGDTNNLFITNTSTIGKINVVAIRNGLTPFPTDTVLLRVNFGVNSGATGSALIDFTDTPTQRLATDAAANTVTLNSSFGRVMITPTAANVSVSGRVTTSNGNGLRNAIVLMTDSTGTVRQFTTGSFGYYRFDDVQVGQNYVFQVVSKRFAFTQQIVTVNEELTELNFAADPF